MKIIITSFLLFLTSCSISEKKSVDYLRLGEPSDHDYIEHLASIGKDYLESSEIFEIKLKEESVLFLEQVFERIISNNELLFGTGSKPRFHIVLNKIPFLFSLPNAQFFISSGLIEKYLKSEELFVAALTAEIIKSGRNIYEKKLMIPLGFYSTEKMIQISRLKPETKYLLNEWSYIVLKRAGYEPTAYLNWIQVQNRNPLDFSTYLKDTFGISKEEHIFKNFMARQGVVGVEKKTNEANSSKAFYKLLNNVVSNK